MRYNTRDMTAAVERACRPLAQARRQLADEAQIQKAVGAALAPLAREARAAAAALEAEAEAAELPCLAIVVEDSGGACSFPPQPNRAELMREITRVLGVRGQTFSRGRAAVFHRGIGAREAIARLRAIGYSDLAARQKAGEIARELQKGV